MKLARRLKQVLLFIFNPHYSSSLLHIRLWVIWREMKSRINIAKSRRGYFSSTYPNDKAFLGFLTNFETLEEFTSHIRLREKPTFFFQTAPRKEDTIATLEHIFPETRREALDTAAQICEHIFDLLGSGPVRVTRETKPEGEYQPVDWHMDFKSGYRWNVKAYFKDIPYGHVHHVDIKVPWELSRFQHLPALGKVYWLTGDEKYPREFANEIEDWIESNPPLYGVNWACTMDVAIRAVNWIWAYYFFKDSAEVSDELLLKFLRSLYIHGKFIMENLERSLYGINSNHYLSDVVGLVYLGVTFPEFKDAKKWQEFGVKEVIKEMGKQVYPDGMDYEGSVSYHRLVTELFLSATLLCLSNGISFPDWYMERLEKMIESVMYYTKPDGTAPQIGDNDDGRLHILANYGNWSRLDHRYLLSIGAVPFNRPDFKEAAGEFHEEALWLLGNQETTANSLADYSCNKQLRSKAFPEGGFYIMRRDSLYMIVDCVPSNSKAPSGHKHNSRLSFELFAYDKSFIIDPGAYIYTADKDMRNLFRSTRYHNTVVVDNEEQNRFHEDELFNMGRDAAVVVNRWETNDEYDLLDAEHSGYKRLKNPVTHRRHILFNKKEGCWIIRDTLTGDGEHQFDLYFHLAPLEIELDKKSPLAVTTKTEGANLAIIPLETKEVSVEILEGWVSYRYGVKLKAPIVKYSKKGHTPASFCSILYPYTREFYVGEVIEKVQRLRALKPPEVE